MENVKIKNYRSARLKNFFRSNFNSRILGKIIRKPHKLIPVFWASIRPILFDVKLKPQKLKELYYITNESIKALAELSNKKMQLKYLEHWPVVDEKSEGCLKLAELFNFYGSDKATDHSYYILYYDLLREKENAEINILEIGLGTNNIDMPSNMGIQGKPGASLRAFRDMYPRANVYGADVDHRILFSETRIKTFYVDQTNPKTLSELQSQFEIKFDLIIDDGLHNSMANLNTLNFALPLLEEKGYFVIEDINVSDLNYYKIVNSLLGEQYSVTFIKEKSAHVCVINKL